MKYRQAIMSTVTNQLEQYTKQNSEVRLSAQKQKRLIKMLKYQLRAVS